MQMQQAKSPFTAFIHALVCATIPRQTNQELLIVSKQVLNGESSLRARVSNQKPTSEPSAVLLVARVSGSVHHSLALLGKTF